MTHTHPTDGRTGRPVHATPGPDHPAADDLLESGGEATFGLVQGSHRQDAARGPAVDPDGYPTAIVTEGRLEIGGRPVPYASVGTGGPVLLLPDRGDPGSVWQQVIGRLAGTHLLISVGLPGYEGGSPSSDEECAGGHAALLRGVLDALGQLPVSVVGHGLGAVVALRFAGRHPGLTDRLVLIGRAPADERPAGKVARAWAAARQGGHPAPPDAIPVLRLDADGRRGAGAPGTEQSGRDGRRLSPVVGRALRDPAAPAAGPGTGTLLSGPSLTALERFLDL